MVAAGLLWFARIPVHSNYLTDILPGILLMASGMSVVFVTNTIATTSGVSHKESGLISGLLNTSQQIGGAIGLAVLSVVSTSTTKHELTSSHGTADPVLALVHRFQHGFIAAAVFAVVGSLVAFFVFKNRKPTATDIAREAETEAEALPAAPGI